MDEILDPFTKKLTKKQMESLYQALAFCALHWEADDDHEVLLFHHMIVFRDDYKSKILKRQKSYSIKFKPLEALAISQIIGKVPLEYLRSEGLILQEIANDLDQYRKSISIHS